MFIFGSIILLFAFTTLGQNCLCTLLFQAPMSKTVFFNVHQDIILDGDSITTELVMHYLLGQPTILLVLAVFYNYQFIVFVAAISDSIHSCFRTEWSLSSYRSPVSTVSGTCMHLLVN